MLNYSLPFKLGGRILEVGGGANPLYHPNLDCRQFPTVDVVADLNRAWPVQNEFHDGVFSMYLIEHISWRKVRFFISECHRVLKPNGIAVLVTANFLEQCRTMVEATDWNDGLIGMCFGDQDYEGEDWVFNAHHCGFSPRYAHKLFKEAGFYEVTLFEHPNCKTDLIIEARKSGVRIIRTLVTSNTDIFESPEYWCGELGYRPDLNGIGYQDFLNNQFAVEDILAQHPRGRVLDIGCAFGYIVKRLRDKGIDAWGIDISHYALSQAPVDVKPYLKHGSADNLPWPDNYFDMVVTFGTLEHLDSEMLPKAISEIKRVAKRGIITVSPGDDNDFDNDITHQTKQPLFWWRAQFPPEFEVLNESHGK